MDPGVPLFYRGLGSGLENHPIPHNLGVGCGHPGKPT